MRSITSRSGTGTGGRKMNLADKNYKTKLTDRQKAAIKNAYNMLVTFRRIVEEKKMTDTYTSEEIDECYRELYDALLY